MRKEGNVRLETWQDVGRKQTEKEDEGEGRVKVGGRKGKEILLGGLETREELRDKSGRRRWWKEKMAEDEDRRGGVRGGASGWTMEQGGKEEGWIR